MSGASAEERLRGLDWSALSGLAPQLWEILERVLSGTPAERALERYLKAHPSLSAAQRAVAAEVVFGVALFRRRLGAQAPSSDARVFLFVFLVDLAGVAVPEAIAWSGFPPGAAPPVLRPLPQSLADRFSLPDWLAETLQRELPGEAPALSAALNVPGPVCLRANLLKTSRDALASRLASEGVANRSCRSAAQGLIVETPRPNILGLPSHRNGLFEVQDEGSQLIGALLAAGGRPSALDFCAGAGGKTLQLASEMGRGGALHAYDPDAARLERLRVRAERAGVAGLHIHRAPPPAELLVDRVLVDAPCSELGPLRRGPDQRWRIDPGTFEALPALQLQILEAASAHLAPQGRLVYATCTFRREENQEVVQAFLARHPGFSVVERLQLWPHRDDTDGFFAVALERS